MQQISKDGGNAVNEWGRRGWRGSGRGNIRRGEGGWGLVERKDVSEMEGEDRAGKRMSETFHHMLYPIMMGVHPIIRIQSPLSYQTPPYETTCLYAQIPFNIRPPTPTHTLHSSNYIRVVSPMCIASFACPTSFPIHPIHSASVQSIP